MNFNYDKVDEMISKSMSIGYNIGFSDGFKQGLKNAIRFLEEEEYERLASKMEDIQRKIDEARSSKRIWYKLGGKE